MVEFASRNNPKLILTNAVGVFGLYHKVDWQPVPVDLKSIAVHAAVANIHADVSCRFKFHNSSDKSLEAQFIFPLHANAVIYCFDAKIGDKHLIGRCRERVEVCLCDSAWSKPTDEFVWE